MTARATGTGPRPIGLAAYQPDIAPNLGAMIRLCACLGVPLHVIEPCGFPVSAKMLRRAAMDYATLAEVVRHDDWAHFHRSRPAERLVLLSTGGETPLCEFGFRPGDMLMVGRETGGVPDEVAACADARIVIPLVPEARSLNVVTAAAIALGEALRQLDAFPPKAAPAGPG